jgi:hypothetical protein
MVIKKGYLALAAVLQAAMDQAQMGKGKERHANGRDFLEQPIMEIGRMVGPGYQIGQAMKKGQEAMRLPTTEQKVAELMGAINYLAAAVLLIREEDERREDPEKDRPVAAPGEAGEKGGSDHNGAGRCCPAGSPGRG